MGHSCDSQHFDKVDTELLLLFSLESLLIQKCSEWHCGMLYYVQLTPFLGKSKHICLKSANPSPPKACV